MAFHSAVKKKIVRDRETGEHLPCVICGRHYPLPDAVHIIDEKEWKGKIGIDRQVNGIPLCPNCHRVFDEVLRPYLYRAMAAFGATNLPRSWMGSNKLTVTDRSLNLGDESK